MKIADPTFKFIYAPSRDEAYRIISEAMSNCYRAELNATPKTPQEMVEKAIRIGHYSVVEHVSVSVDIICDRGVTHELVRHRLCSYSQESTRYCNYSADKFGRELTFIRPSWMKPDEEHLTDSPNKKKCIAWLEAMQNAEDSYLLMLDEGATPQEARAVLPNSLATKIAMTANLREWAHIFKLRCDLPAHPDMRQTMKPIMFGMLDLYPSVFQPVHNWLSTKGALK